MSALLYRSRLPGIATALASLWCVALSGCGLDWRDPVARKVELGNRKMTEGAPGEALNAYRDAQIDAPDDPRIHFNIGDALYHQRKYEDAEKAFAEASSRGQDKLRAPAAYNAGNALFKQNKLDKAAESFQRALELDPGDRDAKFNLELVQRLLNEAVQRAENQKSQGSPPRASQWARERAREAESLARQGYYVRAHRTMKRTIEAEAAAAAEFGDFTNRLGELAEAFGGAR